MADYGNTQATNSFRHGRGPEHPRSLTNQDEVQYLSPHVPLDGRPMPTLNPGSLNNPLPWAGNDSPYFLLTMDQDSTFEPGSILSTREDAALNTLEGLDRASSNSLSWCHLDPSSRPPLSYSRGSETTMPLMGPITWANPEQPCQPQVHSEHQFRDGCSLEDGTGLNSDGNSQVRDLAQPYTSCLPLYPREHGPLSQQTDLKRIASPNLGRLEDSDGNVSDPVPNQELFSVSSGSEQATPSSSITSAASPSTLDALVCKDCVAGFKGEYRKGNLSRHHRLKHGYAEKIYPCEGPGCKKEYKRKDARLKHYRKHHVELTSGPAASRRLRP